MKKGLFVTGTDTDVGKTWVTSILAATIALRMNENGERRLNVWKPVQSGVTIGHPEADSYRLVQGSGLSQTEQETVTITLAEPLAPWMAAERAGVELEFDKLVNDGRARLQSPGVRMLVEGAGGLMVPLTKDRLIADLAASLGLPVLIVARPRLGTVNHTLLTVEYARRRGMEVAGVILNGYTDPSDPSLKENRRMIEQFGHVQVWGMLPRIEARPQTTEEWSEWRQQWTVIVERELDMAAVMKYFE